MLQSGCQWRLSVLRSNEMAFTTSRLCLHLVGADWVTEDKWLGEEQGLQLSLPAVLFELIYEKMCFPTISSLTRFCTKWSLHIVSHLPCGTYATRPDVVDVHTPCWLYLGFLDFVLFVAPVCVCACELALCGWFLLVDLIGDLSFALYPMMPSCPHYAHD